MSSQTEPRVLRLKVKQRGDEVQVIGIENPRPEGGPVPGFGAILYGGASSRDIIVALQAFLENRPPGSGTIGKVVVKPAPPLMAPPLRRFLQRNNIGFEIAEHSAMFRD